MRAVATVIVPWIVWGLLDTGIYMGLLALSPDSFGVDGEPTTWMLGVFLLLRAGYSVVAGWLASLLALGKEDAIRVAVGLLFLTGVVAQIVNRSMYPLWYHVIFLGSLIPCLFWGIGLGKRTRA